MAVQRQSQHEYVARVQGRYLKATKAERHRLLTEVIEVTGYGRRHALRLLRHGRASWGFWLGMAELLSGGPSCGS